jgi:hypothetical protein
MGATAPSESGGRPGIGVVDPQMLVPAATEDTR